MKNKRELAFFLAKKLHLSNTSQIFNVLVDFEETKKEKIIKREVDAFFEETDEINKNTARRLAERVFMEGEKI